MTTVGRVAWPLMRLGRLVQEVGGATPSKDRPEFWNGDVPWISPKDMKRDVLDSAKDHVTREALTSTALRLVDPGAVLIVVRGMILAHTVPVAENSMPVTLNQDMKALVPRAGAHPRFLRYALKAAQPALLGLVEVAGHGTCCLRSEQWKGLEVPCPPPAVQRAIADFLDRKTAAIDALIEKKERLLALLAEKRAALINRAVTQGLDPTVPMKDSGIPWIGEIPAHWSVLPLRRVLERLGQGWSPVALDRMAEDGEWAVLKLSAVRGGEFRPIEHKTYEGEAVVPPAVRLRAGQVLITRANTPDLVGDACVVAGDCSRLFASDLIYMAEVDRARATSEFVCRYLLSGVGRYLRKRDGRGSSMSMAKLQRGHILGWPIALPPLSEQITQGQEASRILKVDRKLAESLVRQVSLLSEYRQALITAAVTGQLAIDEVAA